MQLKNIHTISGSINLLSGLHIGAGNDTIEIGGLDQPIIKHPLTEEPYIPGSSIKGKLRSLVEVTFVAPLRQQTQKFVSQQGKPCNCGEADCPACLIFGNTAPESQTGPTRLIVRDALLSETWQDKFKRGELPMEVKYENTIDRVKGVAAHPRPLERVPAGVSFDFTMAFKEFAEDDDKLKTYIFQGLRLMTLDALGGNSSRGCGQITFENLKFNDEAINLDDYDVAI